MTEQEFFTKNGSKRIFRRGDVLIHSEEDPSGIYFLESGIVKMSMFFEDGTEITFNLFKPGSFFPMMWAIAETKNQYDFQAITDVITYQVPKKEVLQFLEKEKLIYQSMVKRILTGFDGLLGSMPHLLSGSSVKKTAAALSILARRFGKATNDGLLLDIKIRHEDLAGMTAQARETVSLAIEGLKKRKILQQKKRVIIIKDMESLRNEAGW